MVYSINMLAPNATGNMNFTCRSGNSYSSDTNGVIKTVVGQDIIDLTSENCISLGAVGSKSNYTATTAPTASNDNTQDYGAASRWLNTTTGLEYVCVSAATGAAVWTLLGANDVPWVTGKFYGTPRGVTPAALLTLASTLYAYPVIVPNQVTLATLNLSVTTGQTGGAAHIGLYADTGAGYPGSLIVDSGILAATATAVVNKTGLSIVLAPGIYWAASIFTTSVTYPSVAGTTVAYTNELANMCGFDTAAHALATSAQAGGGLTVAGTYGALPATFTTGAALNLNAGIPLIALGV
jgi:hypothetical protein